MRRRAVLIAYCGRLCYHADMIKELLAYQEKDKERLTLLYSVEGGRVKREIDAANHALTDAKATLLALENDAKSLTAMFESSVKNLKELFDRVEQYGKTADKNKSEDEIASAANYISALMTKITGYENQLEDITKRISQKNIAFEETKAAVVRAQKNIAGLTPQYQAQRKEIESKVAALDAELDKLGKLVNRELLEKYKQRRRADKSGKIADIAVAMLGDKCGGCFCEMPLLLTHKIKTNGYIICESCGKIIY